MAKALSTYLQFLWTSLLNSDQTGAVVPSSRFLIAKMIAPVPTDYSRRILELGPGNGVLTLRLAARCPRATILACEINEAMARDCRKNIEAAGISKRVSVVSDSAENLLSEMMRKGTEKPEFIFSGIPLGNLDRASTAALVDKISQCLAPNGMYIQFQYSLMDRKTIQAKFPRVRTVPAFLNFPPAFVYYAQK